MDYDAIAKAALTAVLPYLALGGQEFSKSVGKDLWELIKKPFKLDKDKKIIEELKQNPDDQKIQGKLELKLSELLEEEPEVAEDLNKYLKGVKEEINTNIVKDSKNVFMSKTTSVGGSIIIGDNNEYKK